MKKIVSIATVVAIFAMTAISCKKSDDAGTTPTPNPKAATLTKAVGDTVLNEGLQTLMSNFNFTVVDTTKVQVVHLYSLSTTVHLENVRVVFTGSTGSITASCEYNGVVPEGQEFLAAPFGKYFLPDTYSVKAYADVTINGVRDSTELSLSLDCMTGTSSYNLKAKNNQIFFITGNVSSVLSPQTPVSKKVYNTTGVQMTTITTSVAGINQTLTGVSVAVNNPLVSAVKVLIGGSVIGTTSVNGVATYVVPTNKLLVKGTSTDITIAYDFGSFTSTTQTGFATTAIIKKLTFADQNQNDPNTYTGNPMYVYKAFLSFKNSPVSQTVSTSSLDLFTVQANATGNTAGEKQMSFSVVWGNAPTSTDTLASVIRFFEGTTDITSQVNITAQNGDTIPGNKITPSVSVITVTWKSGESVINTSKTYTIKGICSGFNTAGSYLQIGLLTDASPTQVVGVINYSGKFKISVGGTSYNVWTDRSNPAHTSVVGSGSTADWINSAYVDNNTYPTVTGL